MLVDVGDTILCTSPSDREGDLIVGNEYTIEGFDLEEGVVRIVVRNETGKLFAHSADRFTAVP